MDEILVVTADSVCQMINSFVERMMAEQCRLLKSGSPDDATNVMLAELILEFIISISRQY